MTYVRVKYGYASGLGNRLWPWARFRVYSALHDIQRLRTTWAWPMRIGPLIKQRMDPRTWPGHLYLDQFRAGPGEIGGMRRLLTIRRLPESPEPEVLAVPPALRDAIIVFSGNGKMFADLAGHERFLRGAIREITRPRWLRVVDRPEKVEIGIHVRRSDFTAAATATDLHTKGFIRTPLSWFVATLRQVRAAMRRSARAIVVSDGHESELSELLDEPDVHLISPSSPISDMLILSRSRVLIGSGGSSFSAWAAFLGEMPAVTHPGQSLRWFKLEPRAGQYLGEFDPLCPPADFLDQVAAR